MRDRDIEPAAPAARTARRRALPWRAWLRALHRDLGYSLVGLTFVYALSGLAINHIDDWDPNFAERQRVHQLAELPAGNDEQIAAAVQRQLKVTGEPREIYRAADQLEIVFDSRVVRVDLAAGEVVDQTREPRFFLRVANWLHYNRGKAAWTYVADAYAALLLFLACSGAFMLKGRKGLLGRGAILIALGAAVPIVYVQLSGGP
jgi:uncharacterized protein